MLISNPLRSPLAQAISSAFNVIDGLIPTPSSTIYGAAADAGEIDDATSITGTRYWWNFGTGSDANDPPTSSAAPAQTLARLGDWTSTLGTRTAPSGSGFMFARGQSAVGFLVPNNFSGSFYGDYLFGATGTGARPVIQFANSLALFNSNSSLGFFNRPGTRVRNLSLDMQKGLAANATAIVGSFTDGDVVTGGTSGATAIFHYNNSGQFQFSLTSYPTMFTSGETITDVATGLKSATIATFTYLTGLTMAGVDQEIRNSDMTGALGNGILLSTTPTNFVIDNVTVSDCCLVQANGAGIDGGLAAGGQIINTTVKDCGNGGTSHNIYVNDLTNSTISGNWSYMTTNRGNHAFVVHGTCSNVLIEDNLFEKCNNGIGINDGYSSAEVFDLFTIRKNINRLHGSLPGQTQGQAMELACLTNSSIYNNLHYSTTSSYNLRAKRTSGGADTLSANVTISHETIYNVVGGFKLQDAMSGIVVQNCIIMSTAASGFLLDIAALSIAGLTLRNCVLYMPNNSGTAISWNGSNYTLAAWMTAVGNALGCINADPLFTNAAGNDFTLQAGSPCKLAGYNSGITTDFADNARHATTPSIGAYE